MKYTSVIVLALFVASHALADAASDACEQTKKSYKSITCPSVQDKIQAIKCDGSIGAARELMKLGKECGAESKSLRAGDKAERDARQSAREEKREARDAVKDKCAAYDEAGTNLISEATDSNYSNCKKSVEEKVKAQFCKAGVKRAKYKFQRGGGKPLGSSVRC